jgi:hypothetical protein
MPPRESRKQPLYTEMFADLSPWSFYDFAMDRPIMGRKRARPSSYDEHDDAALEGRTLRSGRVVRLLQDEYRITTWEDAMVYHYHAPQAACSSRVTPRPGYFHGIGHTLYQMIMRELTLQVTISVMQILLDLV